MFHRHFSTNFKVFHCPKFAQKKAFFSPRGSAGVATLRVCFERLLANGDARFRCTQLGFLGLPQMEVIKVAGSGDPNCREAGCKQELWPKAAKDKGVSQNIVFNASLPGGAVLVLVRKSRAVTSQPRVARLQNEVGTKDSF